MNKYFLTYVCICLSVATAAQPKTGFCSVINPNHSHTVIGDSSVPMETDTDTTIIAAPEEFEAPGLQVNGAFWAQHRMELQGNKPFSFKEYRLELKAAASVNNSAQFKSELWLRSLGFSRVQTAADLFDREKSSPRQLELREAYVDLGGFLFENLDLRIGRQRIAWGTGDRFNPTDNINPDDLEDIWDFGRHLGSDGIKLSYYWRDWIVSGVYIPDFTPAQLPQGAWANIFNPGPAFTLPFNIGNVSQRIVAPANTFKDGAIAGIKISGSRFRTDISLSYLYGRDDLPLMHKVICTPANQPGLVNLESELIFPRYRVLGADLSSELPFLANLGIWAEAAVFFPDQVDFITDLTRLGLPPSTLTLVPSSPYCKYVFGLDYSFKNGLYLNAQFIHGFIHERRQQDLADYMMFRSEWRLWQDKIKLVPMTLGLELKDHNQIRDNYALIWISEIEYQPVDNASLGLGVLLIDGKPTTTFGRLSHRDEIYLKLRCYF